LRVSDFRYVTPILKPDPSKVKFCIFNPVKELGKDGGNFLKHLGEYYAPAACLFLILFPLQRRLRSKIKVRFGIFDLCKIGEGWEIFE